MFIYGTTVSHSVSPAQEFSSLAPQKRGVGEAPSCIESVALTTCTPCGISRWRQERREHRMPLEMQEALAFIRESPYVLSQMFAILLCHYVYSHPPKRTQPPSLCHFFFPTVQRWQPVLHEPTYCQHTLEKTLRHIFFDSLPRATQLTFAQIPLHSSIEVAKARLLEYESQHIDNLFTDPSIYQAFIDQCERLFKQGERLYSCPLMRGILDIYQARHIHLEHPNLSWHTSPLIPAFEALLSLAPASDTYAMDVSPAYVTTVVARLWNDSSDSFREEIRRRLDAKADAFANQHCGKEKSQYNIDCALTSYQEESPHYFERLATLELSFESEYTESFVLVNG